MFFGGRKKEDKNPKKKKETDDEDKYHRETRKHEPKREEPRREEPKRNEPRREEAKRDEPRNEEPKREMSRRNPPKREEPKIEEPRREEPKKEESRREPSRNEEQRKIELRREAEKREEPKKDEPRKDEPKRNEPRREEVKREVSRRNLPKKEEPKTEEPRREEPKKEESRREPPRNDEPKRVEPRREAEKRDEARKDEPKRDEPRNEELNKEDPRNEESRRKDSNREERLENQSDEYDMRSTDYSSDKESKSSFFSGIVRIIASSPIVVSTLSLSHLIVNLKPSTLILGIVFISIHYVISFIIIAKVSEENYTPTDSLSSLTYDTVYPLSLIVDIYLVILKFLTSIFYVDLLFEVIYSFIPDFRLDDLSFGLSKSIIVLFVVTLFIVVLLIYRLFDNLRFIFECIVIGFSISLLICIILYSTLGISKFADDSAVTGEENRLSSILFLTFVFLSFSMECQSESVRSFKSAPAKSFIISIVSVSFISIFFILFIYFGSWILKKRLPEVLELTITSTSGINRFLKGRKVDEFNILPKVTMISFFVNGLIGYLINVSILGKSLIQCIPVINKGSSVFEVVVIFITVFLIVFLVVLKDIGRFLWLSTKIIFFGFPLFAMYPYISVFCLENRTKILFVISLLALLVYISIFFLSFFYVPKLGPEQIKE